MAVKRLEEPLCLVPELWAPPSPPTWPRGSVLLLDIVPRELTPDEEKKGLTLQSR